MLIIDRLCCMRLHTVGVVVGWLGATLSFLNVVLYAVILARLDEFVKFIIDNVPTSAEVDADSLKSFALVVIPFLLTLSVVSLISCVLLIAGTMNERHLMLVPWLFTNGIAIVFNILNLVSTMWFYLSKGVPFGSVLVFVIISGSILVIQYIIWSAIYSLFRKISMSREHQQLIPNNAGQAYPSYTKI